MRAPPSSVTSPLTRRQFLKNSGLAVVAGTLAAHQASAQNSVSRSETLRVGLIGCGGRSTGAAAQALAADPNVKLVALGDAFRGRLQGSLATLKRQPELFAGIRAGKPINNGDYMTKSTLMAIMGRTATYTGQETTWEQAMNSQEDLSPDRYDWDAKPPASVVAIPGVTKIV